MSTSPRRGQSMVLLCLTMLLLTLMVTLTLSFSQRVREKMETQSVADLAAYSSAVATARTFNTIALMRRAQTGHLVAMTATSSLISWTSMMRANLNASRLAARGCPAAAAAIAGLEASNAEIELKWKELDTKAGLQTRALQQMAGFLRGQQEELFEQLQRAVNGGPGSLTAQVTALAAEGSPTPGELRPGPTPVSVNELVQATGGDSFAVDVLMASRGYGFITRRTGASGTPSRGILEALGAAGGSIRVTSGGGSAYWGRELGHGLGNGDATAFLWAEDHATVEVRFPGCPPLRMSAFAGVRSTDANDTTDDHWWRPASPGLGTADPGLEKQVRHTLGPCTTPGCPNTFVDGLAYNTGDRSDDNLWAQPKLFSLVRRDYAVRGARPDPWNHRFELSFSAGRSSTFDNHGLKTAGGVDIRMQSALATGLAYYHRRGHWNEPPNLWNPFWRATLVAADVDAAGDPRRGGQDIPDTVGGTAAEAFRQLIHAGYRGVH